MQIISRRRRLWYFGGAFALLFCVLFSFRLGLFNENILVRNETDITADGLPAKDYWMIIYQGDRKIGYAHKRFFPVSGGHRLIEEVFMRINTMGAVQPITFRTEGRIDSHMRLNSFNFNLDSSMFHFIATGVVKDKILTLYAGSPGGEKQMDIPLKEPLYLSAGLFEAYPSMGLKKGESRILHVFDPASMGERPVKVTLLDAGEVMFFQGKKIRAKKLALDFMGTTQFAWLGDDGAVLREKGILEITMERASKEEALKRIGGGQSADFTELASVSANKRIGHPEALEELKIRLTNIDRSAFYLDGGRQALEGDALMIRKEKIPAVFGRVKFDRNSPLLKPTPLIQSDHPLILRKARKIIAGGASASDRARKLVMWVNQNVKKRPVLSVPNALETLINLTGDCNEHAVLLAALARSIGIPADVEAGLVYLRGRFYYHAWNVFYLGNWVTADAVLGQMPADVTHIRFVRGSTERQADLLGIMGRLRMEIIGTRANSDGRTSARGEK